MRDLPSISGSTYASSAVNLAAFGGQVGQLAGLGALGNGGPLQAQQWRDDEIKNQSAYRRMFIENNATPTATSKSQENSMSSRRLVQVFIGDPNENVPLDQSLLYRGEQKLTDATDQELFFEIDIKAILEKHNTARVKMVDKKVKERVEHLEPAKVRDLKMVVVTIAQF